MEKITRFHVSFRGNRNLTQTKHRRLTRKNELRALLPGTIAFLLNGEQVKIEGMTALGDYRLVGKSGLLFSRAFLVHEKDMDVDIDKKKQQITFRAWIE